MKRLFGTIGLTYLTVLAVAFFLPGSCIILIAAGFELSGCGLVLILKKYKNGKSILIAGISAALAVTSIFLYQNYIYKPIVHKYSCLL